jgi:Uma2 family endonuclease
MHGPILLGPDHERRINRDEYERLINRGVLEDLPIELLRGELVQMSPQKEPHSEITAWFHERLVLGLDLKRYQVRGQSSFAATEDSVPEPDVAVFIRERRRRLPREAILVIEVAMTSLPRDRRKAGIYAESGVPEYWIANVRAHTVEVHTKPRRGEYTSIVHCRIGETLRPACLRGFSVRAADIPWAAPARRARKH